MTAPTRFPYLWVRRVSTDGDPLLVQVLATNGKVVRHVSMAQRQIYLQEVESPVAKVIVDHVEEGLHRGQSLVGYSMLEGDGDVCVRVTGDEEERGWLAFRDPRGLPRRVLKALEEEPRRRLVAGAAPKWRPRRRLYLYCAFEERGPEVCPGTLVETLESVEVCATRKREQGREFFRLPKSPWTASEVIPDPEEPGKLRCRIPLEDQTFHSLLSSPEVDFWLRLGFTEELLCLPRSWRVFHLHVRPQ